MLENDYKNIIKYIVLVFAALILMLGALIIFAFFDENIKIQKINNIDNNKNDSVNKDIIVNDDYKDITSDNDNILYDEEEDAKYYNNRLILSFVNLVTEQNMTEFADKIDAKIIYINSSWECIIEINKDFNRYKDLADYATYLEERYSDEISYITIQEIY